MGDVLHYDKLRALWQKTLTVISICKHQISLKTVDRHLFEIIFNMVGEGIKSAVNSRREIDRKEIKMAT